MTITIEEMRKDLKGYVLRLNSGQALSLANWWIMQMEAEGVYLIDGGDWSGRSFYFKLGEGGHCLASTEEGWVDIGVFEAVARKGGEHDEKTPRKEDQSGPSAGYESTG